jgi:hypothetical protein
MADTKITGLTALTGANSASDDLLTLVDVSDTTMDAAGTNKSITRQELQTYNAGTLTTDVKVLDLSVTWNNAGVTFTGLKFNVTDTASANSSKFFLFETADATKFQLWAEKAGSSDYWLVMKGANVAIKLRSGAETSDRFSLELGGMRFVSTSSISWASSSSSQSTGRDLYIYRDAAATLAQRNSTNAQTFNLYNTYTDASNYERLAISWGSNIVSIKPENAGTGSARVLHISGLPTSNPGAGILWNNGGTPAIGT